MRVIVTGSRDLNDYGPMTEAFRELLDNHPDAVIVHGGAKGADRIADDLAWDYGFPTVVYAADWEKYGKAAGPIRNQYMIDAGADLVLAFPGPNSVGTYDCIQRAEKAGIPVKVTLS